MKENRLILTARGTGPISRIDNMEIGDEVSVTVSITDTYGNTAAWRTVTEAVGGHIPPVRGGVDINTGIDRADPMTIIGFKADGTVVMIVNDGRQPGYSIGINRTLFDELCIDLGIDTALLLDGGGSTTLIELTEQGYELKNRPSDFAVGGRPGIARDVVNAVILSYVSDEPVNPPVKIVPVDVNGDGIVTSVDIMFIKRAIVGKIGLDETQRAAADVNSDGKINAGDLLMIKRAILGLISLAKSKIS